MSFSIDILSNIKTMDDSENEMDMSKEVFLEEEKMINDIGLSPKVECDVRIDNCVDPLLERVEVTRKSNFIGQYNENDFVEEEYFEETDQKPVVNRGKRARMSTELKAKSGVQWSSTKLMDCNVQLEESFQIVEPKCKGPAKIVRNPLESWLLLMDERILSHIVKCTNEEIRQHKGKGAYQRLTDLTELRAFLGLNYLCGIFRNAEHKGPLEELWTPELGNAVFRATMSVKRFEFLAESLQFSEIQPTVKKKQNSFQSVEEIWEKFIINCRSYYAPSGNCTIDEVIVGTSDKKCPTHFALPKCKSENGLRLITLCDAKSLYMSNAILSTLANPCEEEVLQLISDIKGTNRNVILTDRYTNVALGKKLSESRLTMVGAMSGADKDIPSELFAMRSNKTGPQQLFSNTAMLTVNSTEINTPSQILLSYGLPSKISPEKVFHCTSESCQTFHELSNVFSTQHSTSTAKPRWQLSLFYAILNYAAFNAWTLLRLSENGDVNMTQRDFQRQLGLYLTQQQLKRRLQNNSRLTLNQKLQISEILGEPTEYLLSTAAAEAKAASIAGTIPSSQLKVPEEITLMSKLMDKRARCRKCRGSNNPKTRSRCQQCLRPLCHRHLILRCDDCTGVQVPESTQNATLGDDFI